MLSFYPSRYLELSHYRRHISDLDQCFHWAAVLSYDAQFWHKCTLHNLPLSAFDQQLYMTILDATVAKATACRCICCQHYEHEVTDCPFPRGPHWRRRQQLRRQCRTSRARETSATSNSAPTAGAPALSSQQYTFKAEKSASSFSQHHAVSPTADGPISTGIVSRNTLLQNVVLWAQSPLNHDSFSRYWPATPTGSGVTASCRVFAKGWILVIRV